MLYRTMRRALVGEAVKCSFVEGARTEGPRYRIWGPYVAVIYTQSSVFHHSIAVVMVLFSLTEGHVLPQAGG